MLPNSTQAITTTSALVGVLAGYAAGQHWLGLDAGAWTTVIGGAVAVGAVVVPAVMTRLQSLKNTVGNSGAKVITSPASADALPNNPNVIAATPAVINVVGSVK